MTTHNPIHDCLELAVDFYKVHISDKPLEVPDHRINTYRAYVQLGGYIVTGKVPAVPVVTPP